MITTINYYLETTHHLEVRAYGFDLDIILDSVELATQARSFTNLRGAKQTYLLVTLEGETWGVGYILRGDCLVCTTLLTTSMVRQNELGSSSVENFTHLKGLAC